MGSSIGLVPLGPRETRPYQEIRGDLRAGDLLCFRGAGLISGTIRWLTNSTYSHVGILYLFEGRRYCLEAVGSGVRLALLSELVRHYQGGIDHFELVDATEEQRCGAISFVFQQLGKLYDKDGLLRFLGFLITGKKNRPSRAQRWFCSEIVAEAYRRQGFAFSRSAAAYTSPSDIAASTRLRFRTRIKKG